MRFVLSYTNKPEISVWISLPGSDSKPTKINGRSRIRCRLTEILRAPGSELDQMEYSKGKTKTDQRIRQMTDQEYRNAIPPWCYFQTLDQHREHLGFCWGIMGGLKKKVRRGGKIVEIEGEEYCKPCEFYRGGENVSSKKVATRKR